MLDVGGEDRELSGGSAGRATAAGVHTAAPSGRGDFDFNVRMIFLNEDPDREASARRAVARLLEMLL